MDTSLGYRVRITTDHDSDQTKIYLTETSTNGQRHSISTVNPLFKRTQIKDEAAKITPLLSLNVMDTGEVLQALTDELQRIGYKPTNTQGEGELQALRENLADLRALFAVRSPAAVRLIRTTREGT